MTRTSYSGSKSIRSSCLRRVLREALCGEGENANQQVEIQSEVVVHLDAFLDLLHVLDFDAEARLLGAVCHPGFLGLCVAELLDLGDDVFGGHLLSPSNCM